MKQLLKLAITDFKLIFRDPSLRVFLILPVLIFLVVLVLMPQLIQRYPEAGPFASLVLMGACLQTGTMFGFIYSMVLINEKDIHVAAVYGVVPVSKQGFIISRLSIPFFFSFVITYLLLMVQPFYKFTGIDMFGLSVLAALFTPLITLVVTLFSKNKMEGMTWFKLINLLITIPLAAFFIEQYAWAFGILPSHWVYQTLNKMVLHQSTLIPLSIGFVFVLSLMIVLIKRFAKHHFT